ncbi:MAG: tetratricopeptide repeat protein [Defluviitaleaceae bacterium]|nr:tetratricopeptide repeat protein [Defluviitaleaceae bacterium]
MTNLYLTASQTENTTPYIFPMTGTGVFSLEEALYHCLHNWRGVTHDFLSEPFIKWVEGSLGLGKIGASLREISRIESFSMRFLAFLSVVDYLPKRNLEELQKELGQWERQQVWEKLAEQGDYWAARGEGERAYSYHARALNYHEGAKLLNNAGVALMYTADYAAAAEHFTKALALESGNKQLNFNLIEAHILGNSHDAARDIINKISANYPNDPELLYFQAEIHFKSKNYFDAIKLYENAVNLNKDPQYIYRLCDCYMKMRLYDKALEAIKTVDAQDVSYLRKLAGYYVGAGNVPQAIKSIEKALVSNVNDAELWITLAGYHRLDLDLGKASGAITKALSLSAENPAALLEQARIRKAQGRTKEYQGILGRILARFKRDYREMKIT